MDVDMTQISKTGGKRREPGYISVRERDGIGESMKSKTKKTLVDRGEESL